MLGGAVAAGLKGLDQPTSLPIGTKDLRPRVLTVN
jgi:hypothetical protein